MIQYRVLTMRNPLQNGSSCGHDSAKPEKSMPALSWNGTTLIIGPHPDDVALGCTGLLGRSCIEALHLFSGPPQKTPTLFAHSLCNGKSAAEWSAARKKEDQATLERFGVQASWEMLIDAAFRTDSNGISYYPTWQELCGTPVPEDEARMSHQAEEIIVAAINRISPAQVLFPMAIGGHVDHRILHRIGVTMASSSPVYTVLFYWEGFYGWPPIDHFEDFVQVATIPYEEELRERVLERYPVGLGTQGRLRMREVDHTALYMHAVQRKGCPQSDPLSEPGGLDCTMRLTLRRELEAGILRNKQIVHDIVRDTAETGRQRLFELSAEILLLVDPSKRSQPTLLHLGFPFPICTWSNNLGLTEAETGLQFFIRGDPVRIAQREALRCMLETEFAGLYWEELDAEAFRTRSYELLTAAHRLVYIDPYNNPGGTRLGDSIIGMTFLDALAEATSGASRVLFSRSHEHLRSIAETFPLDNDFLHDLVVQTGDVFVMPDVVDWRWHVTMSRMVEVLRRGAPILVVARSLIVRTIEDGVEVSHLRGPDVLLTHETIDAYMDSCVTPFVSTTSTRASIKPSERPGPIFINPFTFSTLRDLDPEFVLELVCVLEHDLARPILISRGVPGSTKDMEWISRFEASHSHGPYVEVLPQLHNLAELHHYLSERDVAVAITADTSVSHLLCRIRVPHVTIASTRYWDLSSVQSCATIFLRSSPYQLPALMFPEGPPLLPSHLSQAVAHLCSMSCPVHSNVLRPTIDEIRCVLDDLHRVLERNADSFSASMYLQRALQARERCRSILKGIGVGWSVELFDEVRLLESVLHTGRAAELLHGFMVLSTWWKVAQQLACI